jgi:hypothetical protein
MWRVSTVLSLNGLSTPYSFSEAARDRGTAVHAYNHAVATGVRAALAADDPYAAEKQALLRWYDDFAPTVIMAEQRLVSPQKRCTGRIDLAVVCRQQAIIVDIKTGSPAAWHGIQVAGYVDLAQSAPSLYGPWARAVLYLHDTGKYEWRGPVRLARDGPQDDFLWRSALALCAWKYDHQLLAITDSTTPADDGELHDRIHATATE